MFRRAVDLGLLLLSLTNEDGLLTIEILQALYNARVEEAEREVLRDTLGVVGARGMGLPEEVSWALFSLVSGYPFPAFS